MRVASHWREGAVLALLTAAGCEDVVWATCDGAWCQQTNAQLPDAPCTSHCTIDVAGGTHDCRGPIALTMLQRGSGTGRIDLSGAQGLLVTLESCDATGFNFHVADSPTCNGWAGDSASFSNDAEIHTVGSTLLVYGNDYQQDPRYHYEATDFLPARGCAVRRLWIADRRLQSFDPPFDLTSDFLLRVDPPEDYEGYPDALWYFGLNRVVGSASRFGTGLVRVEFCMQ